MTRTKYEKNVHFYFESVLVDFMGVFFFPRKVKRNKNTKTDKKSLGKINLYSIS